MGAPTAELDRGDFEKEVSEFAEHVSWFDEGYGSKESFGNCS
jgi:hypothetical protein